MKVIILAGGFGTRLGDLTEIKPKPMVEVGGMPIIWHIMKIYSSYGFNEFIVALGYKAFEIKKYFSDFLLNTANCRVDLSTGKKEYFNNNNLNWKVELIDTGLHSMTGGRIKRLKDFIGNETFLLTYGDGVSNIEIDKLLNFHKKNKKILTVTAVRPIARFGELIIKDNIVENFDEKPQISDGWVNGGFFVCEPKIFDYIENDNTVFEKGPLEKLSKEKQLAAYKHYDFWHCLDTKRDKKILDDLWSQGSAKWTKNWIA